MQGPAKQSKKRKAEESTFTGRYKDATKLLPSIQQPKTVFSTLDPVLLPLFVRANTIELINCTNIHGLTGFSYGPKINGTYPILFEGVCLASKNQTSLRLRCLGRSHDAMTIVTDGENHLAVPSGQEQDGVVHTSAADISVKMPTETRKLLAGIAPLIEAAPEFTVMQLSSLCKTLYAVTGLKEEAVQSVILQLDELSTLNSEDKAAKLIEYMDNSMNKVAELWSTLVTISLSSTEITDYFDKVQDKGDSLARLLSLHPLMRTPLYESTKSSGYVNQSGEPLKSVALAELDGGAQIICVPSSKVFANTLRDVRFTRKVYIQPPFIAEKKKSTTELKAVDHTTLPARIFQKLSSTYLKEVSTSNKETPSAPPVEFHDEFDEFDL